MPAEGEESIRGVLTVDGVGVPDVEVDVRRDGQSVGTGVSGAEGEWIVVLPSAGTYEVQLGVETLPPGIELRNPDRSRLELTVREGQQSTALFALRPATVQRHLAAYRIDSGDEAWDIDLGEGPGVVDVVARHGRLFVFGADGSLTAWASGS